MMFTKFLDSLLPGLRIDNSDISALGIVLHVSSVQPKAACPVCSTATASVHSSYERTLADLPWCGRSVHVHVHVHKFFCKNPFCHRKIFTERLPRITQPYSRQTTRLRAEQRQLAQSCGGEAAARISHRQGFPTSGKTHLRRLLEPPVSSASSPRWLGVDDWALRKGQIYGTILVDLERHQPVDLLPDRTANTLADWLRIHPGCEIITRDRAIEYADGISQGAPHAVQVADRFHLVKNVHEAMQRLVERHSSDLRAAATAVNAAVAESMSTTACLMETTPPEKGALTAEESSDKPEKQLTKHQQQMLARRSRRYALYCEVQRLYAGGVIRRQISRQLGIHRCTLRRFLVPQFPECASRPHKPSILDPHIPYLTAQMQAGCDNGMQLWRDLYDEHGYRGSRALVSRWVAANRSLSPVKSASARRRGRQPASKPRRLPPRFRTPSVRAATWLLTKDAENLTADQLAFVQHLCALSVEVEVGHRIARAFHQMVTQRQSQALDAWFAQVETDNIPEFTAFAAGLHRDEAAVRAALTLPHSNRQVEGQITRLKLIKRTMYGRGSFELLKRRVLAA